MKQSVFFRVTGFTLLILTILSTQTGAHAATIAVDDSAGCSLREAVLSANSDISVNNCTAGSGADTLTLSERVTYEISNNEISISSDITIVGAVNAIIQKDSSSGLGHRLFNLTGSNASLTLDSVEVYGDYTYSTSGSGGCIFVGLNTSLTLKYVTLSLCLSDSNGGAIYIADTAQVKLIGSEVTISGALSDGGGIYVVGELTLSSGSAVAYNDADGNGGGIYMDGSLAKVDITQSAIYGNESITGAGIMAEGGSLLTLSDSTISENDAKGFTGSVYGNVGGGLYLTSSSEADLSNCTLAYNTSGGLGGGLAVSQGTATLDNCIVAGNTSTSGGNGQEIYLFSGSGATVSATDYNIFGESGLANATAFYGYTPSSGLVTATSDGSLPTALASIIDTLEIHDTSEGGSTYAHALASSSPALDLGDVETCSSRDQLGNFRDIEGTFFPIRTSTGAVAVVNLGGNGCDLGAYEE